MRIKCVQARCGTDLKFIVVNTITDRHIYTCMLIVYTPYRGIYLRPIAVVINFIVKKYVQYCTFVISSELIWNRGHMYLFQSNREKKT